MRRFIVCQKCGKKLIEQQENGLWYYAFGQSAEHEPPVEIFIYGWIKLKCTRKTCKHWNELTKFPQV